MCLAYIQLLWIQRLVFSIEMGRWQPRSTIQISTITPVNTMNCICPLHFSGMLSVYSCVYCMNQEHCGSDPALYFQMVGVVFSIDLVCPW